MKIKLISSALAGLFLLASCGGAGNGMPADGHVVRLQAPRLASGANSATKVTLPGNRNAYQLTQLADGSLLAVSGAVSNLIPETAQTLAFDDVSVNLSIGSNAVSIGEADLTLLIGLYAAFLKRVPESDGLNYWIEQVRSGASLDDVAEVFFGAATRMPSETGLNENMDSSAFVRQIYVNLLGRTGSTAPAASEVGYWQEELDGARLSKAGLVRSMLQAGLAAHSDAQWSSVARLLEGKLAVAKYAAIGHGLNYGSASETMSRTREIAALVSPTDTTAALSTVGVTDSGFDMLANARRFEQVEKIIAQRCATCHAAKPTRPGYTSAPGGVLLDSRSGIRRDAARVYAYAVQAQVMPLGNVTQMTAEERQSVGAWYLSGAR